MPRLQLRGPALLAASLALSAALAAAAEPMPPVDFTVYYSPTDRGWEETNAAIEGVMKQFPCLRRTLVRTDAEAGRKSLEAALKLLNMRVEGEAVLIIGPFALVNRAAKREIETYFSSMVARILNPEAGHGRLAASVERFTEQTFGAGAVAKPLPGKPEADMDLFEVRRQGETLGYQIHAFRSLRCPLCNDAQLMLAVEPKGLKVLALQPVRPLELYGRNMDAADASAFLKRYVGRPLDGQPDPADAVSGATKTRKAYDEIIARVLLVLKARLQPASEPQSKDDGPRREDR